jgi:hypothetical protein
MVKKTSIFRRKSNQFFSLLGIRSYHHFQPVNDEIIRCKVTSNASIYEDFSMLPSKQQKLNHVKNVFMISDLKIDDYVVVEYDECWWLAIVQDIEFNLKELKVAFLHPSGPRTSFKSPKIPDQLYVELRTIICLLNQAPKRGTRDNYTITIKQLEEIEDVFSQN